MTNKFSSALLYRVARYYYVDNLSQTSINVSRFGEKFGAQTCYLNISCLKNPEEPFSKAERANIAQIASYWDRLDAAVFSLGAPRMFCILLFRHQDQPDISPLLQPPLFYFSIYFGIMPRSRIKSKLSTISGTALEPISSAPAIKNVKAFCGRGNFTPATLTFVFVPLTDSHIFTTCCSVGP